MSETSEMIQQQISEMAAAEAETAQEAPNEPTEGETAPEIENDAEKPNKANKEAAKYRTQLREAESKLEALNASLDAYRSREVSEVVSEMLTLESADDYFAVSKTSLADYLNEDGTVDTDRVREALKKFREERPAYRKTFRAYDPTQGLGRQEAPSADFSDLLRW